MQKALSAAELAAKYPDPEFRTGLTELLNLQVLMADCIIADKYRVSQDLHQPLRLTDSGERAFEFLTRQKNVPYPEARLLCLLEMWNVDVLVDPIETDTKALAKALGKEINEGKIRFPYLHGRLLYDKAADLEISSSRTLLTPKETQLFLDGTPQGVFQAGCYVTGPFGLLRSKEQRFLDPSRNVRFHCPDVACDILHRYTLQTADDAQIHEHRPKITKALERDSREPSDWGTFLRDGNSGATKAIFNDLTADSLIYLVGDCLDIAELRSVLSWLITETGQLFEALTECGLPTAERTARSLNEAQLLQLICIADNRHITAALDSLVLNRTIIVPDDEVRRPILNAKGSGPYDMVAELNRCGVRLNSRHLNVGPLRLRRLIGDMYPLDNEQERSELDWQMREELAETTEARIEKFIQKRSPREVVSSLLLVRHSNLIVATESLQIRDELLRDDEDRVNSVLWKLGFSISDSLDNYSDFWRYLEATKRACQNAGVNPQLFDVEQIRREAGPFFPELEKVLKDCLAFVTWALLTDHYSSERRFVYRPHIDMPAALKTLHDLQPKDEQGRRISFNTESTLYALVRGFGALADHLEAVRGRGDELLRDEAELPRWAKAQQLQIFPFLHSIPFLDLLPESQSGIIDGLRRQSERMVAAEVSDVRNTLAHPRTADVVKLALALETIEEVVPFLRTAGYLRQQYRPIKTEIDQAGISVTTLSDPFGQTVLMHEPSYFDWLDMPPAMAGVHFMPAAYFYEPSKMLRFVTETSSAFSDLWRNFPRRQKKRGITTSSARPSSVLLGGQRRPLND
ncbi:hypothetical protein FJK98_31005 [Micromonospora sp. HM134]|uniref:hypothetical protein n=1 Tax=Micromonospora sp. HM134 TaxID=2583243 RepID=UPI001198CA88|nr:hypothetical protein [Micromonospora sp. HM134]QDY11034.1 hypothetical protein FJK98_31005 [Micromonospora sp. HM134]